VAYKTKHRIRLLFIEFAAKPIMVFFTDSLVVTWYMEIQEYPYCISS